MLLLWALCQLFRSSLTADCKPWRAACGKLAWLCTAVDVTSCFLCVGYLIVLTYHQVSYKKIDLCCVILILRAIFMFVACSRLETRRSQQAASIIVSVIFVFACIVSYVPGV